MNMKCLIKFILGLIGFVDESDELLCATFKFCSSHFSCNFTDQVSMVMGYDLVNYENGIRLRVYKDGRIVEDLADTCYATVYSFKKSAIAKAKAVYEEDYRKFYS